MQIGEPKKSPDGPSNAREEEGIREINELISFLCSARHNSAINILAQ